MNIDAHRKDINDMAITHYRSIQGKPMMRPDDYAPQIIEVAAFFNALITENGMNTPETEICIVQLSHIAAEMMRYAEAFDVVTGTQKQKSS